MEIKTFKEVHQDLENEALLLKQNHNITEFKDKSSFLNSCGFNNSIATRLYRAISEHDEIIRNYGLKYHCKFLLEEQLERICEKYNLFVRHPKYFLSDIPEINIKEMMNFEVNLYDLDLKGFKNIETRNGFIPTLVTFDEKQECYIKNDFLKQYKDDVIYNRNIPNIFKNTFGLEDQYSKEKQDLNMFNRYSFSLQYIKYFLGCGVLEIAAVKSMFDPEAFKESEARIISKKELIPRSQVELDPIILLRVKGGRLVITAWGDEANDELIFNQKLN